MEDIKSKLISVVKENPARFSCPELARILNLSERQVRYALDKLKIEGYQAYYVKKKLIIEQGLMNKRDSKNVRKSANGQKINSYKAKIARQFYILCWLSSYGNRGCIESILLDRITTDLGFPESTIRRDLKTLEDSFYINKEKIDEDTYFYRLSKRMINPAIISDHDFDRLLGLIFCYGHRIDSNEIMKSVLYKLIMAKPIDAEYLKSRERIAQRIYFLGGEAAEEESVSSIIPVIRSAIMNGKWLHTLKGDIQPLQLLFAKQLGVWYLIGRPVPKTRTTKFRVNNLGRVEPIEPRFEMPEIGSSQKATDLIELEVYPDYSEQKKVLHQLSGLTSIQVYWDENGTMRVFMNGEHREDFIRWLRYFGPSVKVVRPDHFRRQLLFTAEKVIKMYSDEKSGEPKC